ncbi:hypothetical protein QVD17_17845 [Tagetes erecta]|uniref:DUF4378 domain-containing protein n=1 Tax=Tagetes erecta TaxID=13708 RepID=A0AAD8KLK3_TARER|nr:hypothetical protein QVD17_17845 [Tagetes erecta]
MGKNMRGQSTSISLQNSNSNSGCMNKILHALDRRHRWQNVRKVLPNKRQGSGKHIIDGGNNEPIAGPEVPKKNKPPKNEQEIADTRSKKFRIRSIISDEMAKRRGKHQWRRSSSPTRSPKRKTNSNSVKKTENDPGCESPSTTNVKKKRKCDICAAMLTVSYLRQKGLQLKDQKQQPPQIMLDAPYLHSRIGLTKSFSFPLLASTKTRDLELQQLKHKLRDFKDIQTTKEKFILPMTQWKDVGLIPKPMLTRPESFRATCSPSLKEKNQPTNQSKTLKQKIGFVIKVDGRKEKRRILMDAVFHKIPYGGRKSSKDPKKLGPEKLKSTSTNDHSSANKTHLKKTSSTSEAMSKYRKLLSQTSTRDEKLQQHSGDHKPRLFVAGSHSSKRKTHTRIRSLPNINPNDFMHNQEFPVKPTMDIHLSISSAMFDDQRSSERRNVPESVTNLIENEDVVDEKPGAGSDHQVKTKHQNESEAATESGDKHETSLIEKGEAIQENIRVGDDYQEQNDHRKQLLDEHLGVGINFSNHQENTDDQNESRVAIEVKNDKSFNEILGMFKKVSDERVKLNDENESNCIVQKVTTIDKVQGAHNKNLHTLDQQEKEKSPLAFDFELNQDQGVHINLQDSKNTTNHQEIRKSGSEQGYLENLEVSQNILEHNEEDTSALSSGYKVDDDQKDTLDDQKKEMLVNTICYETDWSMQDLACSVTHIPNYPLEDEKKHEYIFSMNDVDEKRANINDEMIKKGFLHLDLESVKDKGEFQFVKQVLEKSGFLKTHDQVLGDWYSMYQPIDPLLFEEVETSYLQQTRILEDLKDEEDVVEKIINEHHLLIFDLINEALLEIHSKTYTYCPHPLTYGSKVTPMPVGCRVLEQVWDIVNMYLTWKPEEAASLDDVVTHDLGKGNCWMNLQGDAEIVGIQVEELLMDDLLDELVFDDLLM